MHTPPPSEMTCSFVIQLVFTSGHQSVTPFLGGAPPPKRNPGSPPESRHINIYKIHIEDAK